jgi:protein involved in polysaccharide export with SLBB domain
MIGRSSALLAIGLLALAVSVGGGEAQSIGVGSASIQNPSLTLRPGDLLRISVWPNAELGGEFAIDEAGYVHLPVLEAVRVAGVPVDQVRAELRRGYAAAMRNPVVNVTPVFTVIVTGAVLRPGVYSITPTHSLFDLLGMAGGFAGSADSEKLRVVRSGQVIQYDALRAIEHGENLDAIQLRSGDQVVVPARRAPFNWRNVLTVVQTISLIFVIYERATR